MRVHCLASSMAVVVLLAAGGASGDTWPWVPERREFRSGSGEYVFVVTGDTSPDGALQCKGEMLRVEDGDVSALWSRPLVNRIGPMVAYVPDSGRYLVTMDEWGSVGRLPIVVYGERGELIVAHSLATLALNGQGGPTRISVSSIWWNEGALPFFGPEGQTFILRLRSGTLLGVDLATGGALLLRQEIEPGRSIVVAERTMMRVDAQLDERLKEAVMALLASGHPRDQRAAALAAADLRLMQAVPLLEELLERPPLQGLAPHHHPAVSPDRARKALEAALLVLR